MKNHPLVSPVSSWMIGVGFLLLVGCSANGNDAFKNAEEPPDAGTDSDVAADVPDAHVAIDPSISEAQEALVEAECTMLYRCCTADELRERFNIDGAEADCDDFESLLPVSVHLANLTESAQAGRIEFDAGMAELCTESYLDQECSEWTEISPSRTRLAGCIEMLTPQVNEGGECKFDYECVSSYCKFDSNEDELGKCTSHAGKGETCFDSLCQPDLYCDTFDDKCLEKKRDGQSCVDDAECTSGACTSDSEGQMQCTPPAPLCSVDGE